MNVVVVRMIKLRDHFVLTTEPVGVKQDLHSLQESGKSDNVHLRRLHTESGYGLRSGLWPTAVFTQVPLAVSG